LVDTGTRICYLWRVTTPAERPRAVLLDYGGTLDGDALHWFDHFVELYARVGTPLPVDVLKPAFYAADDELPRVPGIERFGLVAMAETHVRLQLAALGRAADGLARRLVDAFVADTRTAWDRNRPLLAWLRQRARVGVVSNSYGNMPALLADAALGPFAVIIDSAVEGVRKPDPAIYALAAQRLDLPPETILHVGDSWERDVVPARRIGMRAAWLAAPAAAMPAAPGGVLRLGSLLELREHLA
jgi:putative hydrolase of the HAD superfamily